MKSSLKRGINRLAVQSAACFLVVVFKIIGPPRMLRYGNTLNRLLLKAFGAKVGNRGVNIYSPIILHNTCMTGDYSNLTLGDNCLLNGNIFLDLTAPLTLEDGVSLGPGVTIMTHNSYNHNAYLIETLAHTCGSAPVLIKKGAGIKAHVLIVHGVTIGENAVVAGGAVVNRDLPDNCFSAGVPARVLKEFDPPRGKEQTAPAKALQK